jgi:hypothetical protein
MKYASIILLLTSISLTATASEQWTFSERDGSDLRKAKSSAGTIFAGSNSAIAKVNEGALLLSADGKTESTFRISEFKQAASSGKLEISWTYLSADFSNTAAVKGSGNVGFDLRDTAGTRNAGKDDTVHLSVRLRFQRNALMVQYADAVSPSKWKTLKTIKGDKLLESLAVSVIADLDKGTFAISLNGEEALSDGALAKGKPLTGFRIIQQTINGKNNWVPGDTVSVDNFGLRKID